MTNHRKADGLTFGIVIATILASVVFFTLLTNRWFVIGLFFIVLISVYLQCLEAFDKKDKKDKEYY